MSEQCACGAPAWAQIDLPHGLPTLFRCREHWNESQELTRLEELGMGYRIVVGNEGWQHTIETSDFDRPAVHPECPTCRCRPAPVYYEP